LFHRRVPHLPQTKTSCGLPLLPGGKGKGTGSPPLASTNLRSIHRLMANALPLSL
jgi:hypothetical protein